MYFKHHNGLYKRGVMRIEYPKFYFEGGGGIRDVGNYVGLRISTTSYQ